MSEILTATVGVLRIKATPHEGGDRCCYGPSKGPGIELAKWHVTDQIGERGKYCDTHARSAFPELFATN